MALSDADKLMRVRRFYKVVSVEPRDGGFAVLLDGRSARTVGANALAVPTRPLADLLAEEWAAQGEHIDFGAMAATRLAFTTIDRADDAHCALAREVAGYAAADTLVYPETDGRVLAARQARAWTPWRDWAERDLGLIFETASGVLHRVQPSATLAEVERLANALSGFKLTGLVFAAGLYGSAILALAVQRRALDGVEAFELSRLEEAFQIEQWGVDFDAQARTANLRREAVMIERWFAALQ